MRPREQGGLRIGLPALLLAVAAVVGCATWADLKGLDGGTRAYLGGRYPDAERIWLEALSKAETDGVVDPEFAKTLRMLSNLYIQQERYDEAGVLLERWMKLREHAPVADDGTLADGIEALAGICVIRGEFE